MLTKAEEMKVLDKIEALIKSAGEGSYIDTTFAGIVDVCRKNIQYDFGDSPVLDLEEAREKIKASADAAMSFSAERDTILENFHVLEAAYREAVQVADVARFYLHAAREKARDQVDELPVSASNEEIAGAVREYKKAKEALRRCLEVVEASMRAPLCYSMKKEEE
jgi:hypothetical protein